MSFVTVVKSKNTVTTFLSPVPSFYILVGESMEEMPKFIHGTIEATIFNATPYSPLFPFNVSSPHNCNIIMLSRFFHVKVLAVM